MLLVGLKVFFTKLVVHTTKKAGNCCCRVSIKLIIIKKKCSKVPYYLLTFEFFIWDVEIK